MIKSQGNRKKHLLSIGEASEMLGVHPNTLRRWDAQGVIKSRRAMPNGQRRFRRVDVEAFIGEGKKK